jgi:hypothetical protein
MTNQTKQLCQRLLNVYYAGKIHSIVASECGLCKAWDKVEAMPESAFDELKSEIEKEES